ncbi:hypothetical protein ACHWQZ_G006061 [Mnemiopsis leidyi]
MAHSFTGSLVPCSNMWPTRAKKLLTVHIQTLDVDMEFSVPYKATGKEVFDKVTNTMGLRETWYFGLQSTKTTAGQMWIIDEKRIVDQVYISDDNKPVQLNLLVKFYPQDVNDLIQDITKHLFYLQVKDQILSRIIFAPAEMCVMLASYTLQAKYGDYDPQKHKVGQLGNEQLIPEQVMNQYQLTKEGWEQNVINWYAQHSCRSTVDRDREWAEMQYLMIAENLKMFGVNYFLIQNKRGTDLWLGVDASGLKITEMDSQQKPKIAFPWSEVKNISFQDKKFTIKPVNEKTEDFKFFTKNIRTNRMILQMCVGNHELYTRRNKGDTLVVQALKQQAKEEKKRKQFEREKLEKERRAKEEALRQREELEFRLRKFEAAARKANDKLQRSEEAAEILEEKVKFAEEEANLLAKQATEAQQEILRIRQENNKNNEENQMLKEKLREVEENALKAASKAEVGASEAYRLKQELDSAREREKDARGRLMEITQQSVLHDKADILSYIGKEESLSTDKQSDELVQKFESARLEELKANEEFKNQLNCVRTTLDEFKTMNGEGTPVEEPIEYVDEDKYQTLRRITAGETRSRIAFFHSL